MTLEWFTALATFAFVSSVTPGPNNLMLMASGANFGFRRTLPHMLGVSIGFTVMLTLVGIGLAQLFEQIPLAYTILKFVGTAYLLFLAFKIATATSIGSDTKANAKPFTFIQAALFQWVNVKAWTMALTAMTLYASSQELSSYVAVALVFGTINIPSISLWTVLGMKVREFLTSEFKLRAFNITMAVLLVLSLAPTVL